MSDWKHHTHYRFYMQRYEDGYSTTPYEVVDIEERFQCRYVSLENGTSPALKSVYTEDFAEHDGLRVYTDDDPKFKSSEVTLTLRWRSEECGNVQTSMQFFVNYITGKKIEYHDTFRRNKYWQLIFDGSPEIVAEKLYGNSQYRFVRFKFTNFGGRPYTESHLNPSND